MEWQLPCQASVKHSGQQHHANTTLTDDRQQDSRSKPPRHGRHFANVTSCVTPCYRLRHSCDRCRGRVVDEAAASGVLAHSRIWSSGARLQVHVHGPKTGSSCLDPGSHRAGSSEPAPCCQGEFAGDRVATAGTIWTRSPAATLWRRTPDCGFRAKTDDASSRLNHCSTGLR